MMLTAWDIAAILTKAFSYGAGLVAAGAVPFFLLLPQARQVCAGIAPTLIRSAAWIGLAATVSHFLIKTALLSGSGFAGMFDTTMLGILLPSGEGISAGVRILGLVLLLCVASTKPGPLSLAAAAAVCLSYALTGHAWAHGWGLVLLLSLHLAGISFWIGGLPLLFKACALTHRSQLYELMHGFGRVAIYAVGILVIAGFITAWVLLDSPINLFITDYGRLLLLKLVLVALLLVLAAANKLRWVPLLAGQPERSVTPLRRFIAAEMILVAAILLATAVFTSLTGAPIYDV